MAKSGFVKAMDNLPWIIKIILCLPGLDLIWAIYRIVKGVTSGKLLTLIAGIVWIVVGTAIFWILDLIFTILTGQPRIFA